MSELPIRKAEESQLARPPARARDPFNMMRSFWDWDPFRAMTPLFSADDLNFTPAFEVKENKEGFTIRADLPGVKEKDLEVSMAGSRLTIRGKRESEKKDERDTYYLYERSYGTFTRTFTLPQDVDEKSVHATLDQGVLTLMIAKRAESLPKKIDVKTNSKT